MAHLTPAALDHFECHHGIASPAQLSEFGVTRDALKTLVRLGSLDMVLQGAYRLSGVPLTELGRCAAVCAAHPGHVIAGPTAGRLHGLRRLPSDQRVHTISPPRSQPTTVGWVQPYRTTAFHPDDIVVRPDGIALTSRPRTALDLARWLDDCDLLSVIEQVMRDGRHSIDEMRCVAADWVSPRRRWLRRYLNVLDRRLHGGEADSHDEFVVGDALRRAGVGGLVRQYRVTLPSGRRAFFDLAVPALKWAIEIDAFPTHQETAGRESDRIRDIGAAELGWRVTRLDPKKLGRALSATITELCDLHDQLRSAAPCPSGER